MHQTTATQCDADVASRPSAANGATAPVRIVHLVSALHEGGLERLLLAMAPYWDYSRFSVEVWCLNAGSSQTYLDALQDKGVRVQVLGRLERERIEPSVLWRLVTLLVKHRVSVVHSHTPYPLVVAMLARLFLRTRVAHIHHQHSLPPRYQIVPMYTLGRIRPPDCLIAVSKAMAVDTRALLPNLGFPLSVILNGIEIPNLDVECEVAGDTLHHVFTAARLSAPKNVELLLAAMQKVLQKCPEATLTILGDGELRDSLKEKTRLLGIQDQVSFLGYVLQPERYYSSLGVFVLPSLREGLPLALLEAMAWGKPCVATEVGGMPELLQNEKNGLLVPSNNPDAMADAIVRIIKDPVLARRLGYEARQTAQEFHISKTVDQIQALYDEHIQLPRERCWAL